MAKKGPASVRIVKRVSVKRAGAISEPSSPPAGRPSSLLDTRVIYCGDCLEQLKKLPEKCIDLIYIDPPFNSNRNYEVFWGETKEKRAFEDRHASTQAYIDYMRPRCVELARVLKATGSFYYHCDWHASHYVKVMLDQICGENRFQNEIVWRRTNARHSAKKWPRLHDVLLFYSGGKKFTFHPLKVLGDSTKVPHTLITWTDGKKYNTGDLTGGGITADGESGRPWRGYNPTTFGRHWGYSHAQLDAWDAAGRIHWPKKKTGKAGGFPRLRDEQPFVPEKREVQVGSVWTDIDRLNQAALARLGYPTQKPQRLLKRIIEASSNPNDIVLDAFCGCGTTILAAEQLKRQWIGIDISPTSCRVIAKELRKLGLPENENLWRVGRGFVVENLPWSVEKLRDIPPYEFENWAVNAIGGHRRGGKGADMGIDGRIYPVGTKPAEAMSKGKKGETDNFFADDWFPIQAKQMDKVGRPLIDQFEAVMVREERQRGYFVSFGYTSDAFQECTRFQKQTGRIIKLLTVQEILDEEHVQKM